MFYHKFLCVHIIFTWSAKSEGGRLQLNVHTHPSHTKVVLGWLCCPGNVWESTWEVSSHAPHRGTLIHSHLSLLSHCGLIPGLKEWNWCARSDFHLKKNPQQQASAGTHSSHVPKWSSQERKHHSDSNGQTLKHGVDGSRLHYSCTYHRHFEKKEEKKEDVFAITRAFYSLVIRRVRVTLIWEL